MLRRYIDSSCDLFFKIYRTFKDSTTDKNVVQKLARKGNFFKDF